jgi:hypothetical protein
MPETSVTTPDRRQTPRTKLVEIAYLGMGPENGGLVLDVSDGGLSFHAVAPVQKAATIQFLLSLRGHSRIQGAGQVVWTNESGTVCGLRFTSLSGQAREQLADWTSQSRIAPTAHAAAVPAPPPQIEPPHAEAEAAHSDREPVFAIPPVSDYFLPTAEGISPSGRRFLFLAAFGSLAAALAVIAFVFGVYLGQSRYKPASQVPVPPPAKSTAQPPLPATGPSTSPGSPPSPAVTAPPAGTSAPSTSGNPLPPSAGISAGSTGSENTGAAQGASPAANSAAQGGQRPASAGASSQSQLAAAKAYLSGTSDKRDSARAAQLLWEAVASGNSDAEVILADLYLRGDGVPKSCEQGKVLLTAASNSGNAKGEQKLQELNAKGCP